MPSVPPPEALNDVPVVAGTSLRGDPDQPPWQIWMAPAAVVLGLAGGVVAGIVVDVIGQAAGSSISHPTPAVSLTADLVFDLSFVGAALYFASLRGRPRPADFGFRRIGLRLGVGSFMLAAVAFYVMTAVYASLDKLHGSDKLPSELGVSTSTAALVGAAVFVCVIAPMAEEFFFRGFFFGALRRWRIDVLGRNIGTWVAAILTGILFGLAHTGSASSQYLIPLGFLGFVLCLLRWWTGSLYPCMALHSFNNSLALGVNELHWGAGGILALMAGSMLVIGAVTLPLAPRPAAALS
jgi:membrane protease YdiL (CAAX protease family)